MKILNWIKNKQSLISRLLKNNRLEFIILFFILLLALFLRVYKMDQYMTFLGDEGRDALMIKRILTEFDIPLIGPPTSIGNMYLGPLYYYMMSVPMTIFWLNPVAAAGMVAVIGTLTVGLIFYFSRVWFGNVAAIVASLLYAISPVNIIYSRSSWNPNPTPFFALLAMLGFFKAHKTGNFRWLILTGISLAFAIQMHYLALILIPVFLVLWVYEMGLILRSKLERKHFISGTILAAVLFLSLMSPLLVFDLKHNFMNYRAISTFFTNRETTVNVNPFNTLERLLPIYNHTLIGRYIAGEHPLLMPFVSILVLAPLVIALVQKQRKKALRWSYLALGSWLIVGIAGLALYKQTIYDHYLGFLNPSAFILLGAFVQTLFNLKEKYKYFGIIVTILLVGWLIIINLQRSPLLYQPNNQLKRTQEIAKFVIGQADNKPFNFALIAEHNYDSAYQFYLDIYGHKPKKLPDEMTDQLFVVCEDKICNPVGHSKYEIAAFGWTLIDQEQDFQGVKVFKLIHNPAENVKN